MGQGCRPHPEERAPGPHNSFPPQPHPLRPGEWLEALGRPAALGTRLLPRGPCSLVHQRTGDAAGARAGDRQAGWENGPRLEEEMLAG